MDSLWYLFGHDVDRNAIRMFNLTRVADVELLKEKFPPIAFNFEQHMQGGLVAFAGDAFLQSPLTLDDEAFRQSVRALDTACALRVRSVRRRSLPD